MSLLSEDELMELLYEEDAELLRLAGASPLSEQEAEFDELMIDLAFEIYHQLWQDDMTASSHFCKSLARFGSGLIFRSRN
jgi:hypothetical protein